MVGRPQVALSAVRLRSLFKAGGAALMASLWRKTTLMCAAVDVLHHDYVSPKCSHISRVFKVHPDSLCTKTHVLVLTRRCHFGFGLHLPANDDF